MATGYIGKVQIDSGSILPVGSTLFGVCRTAAGTPAKVIENTVQHPDSLAAAFSPLMDGVTIHVKFIDGNTATSGLTLKVGDTLAHDIKNPGGTLAWSAGAIISFTYDGTDWVCNDGTVTTINVGNEVAAALAQLDVDNDATSAVAHHITGFGAGKTLASLTEVDGIIYATFQDISITTSQISDFPTLGDAAAKGVVTGIVESGAGANKTSTDLPTTNAVTSYIDSKTAGLTGAMHFKGEVQALPTATDTTTYNTYEAGDVVLYGDKEYVYNKGNDAASSEWILLGDEGSYALKTNTASVGSASGWDQGAKASLSYTAKTVKSVKTNTTGVAASLTTNDYTIPNVESTGSAASFTVESGVLRIGTGTPPSLGTAFSVKSVNQFTANTPTAIETEDIACDDITDWSDGTLPTLTVTATTVVVP